MPFAKGKSGNPTGRPRGIVSQDATSKMRALCAQWTETAIQALADIIINPDSDPKVKVLAARELLDRGHGKAHQQVEVSTSGTVVHLGFTKDKPQITQAIPALPQVEAEVIPNE